ncbi:carbohydrate kinase family protein [Streptomyces sparsus]
MSGRPILLGTVTLDFLHEGPLGHGRDPAVLRWGGVAHNAACALGARGAQPVLLTVEYSGELGAAVGAHLARNRVDWSRLPVRSNLPVFHAELVEGTVADKRFFEAQAQCQLTPSLLDRFRSVFEGAGVVVGGTDSEAPTLAWLADTARDLGVPYWLLSADPNTVAQLQPDGRRADLVALNRHELALWAGEELTERDEIVAAARRLPAPGGHCLVTLGESGSLLVPADGSEVVAQAAVADAGEVVTVGAGDVLFGCLLAGRLTGQDWAPALKLASELTIAFLAQDGDGASPYDVLRP